MSSRIRPWYPWYPKEFVADEKVRGLSDDGELIYRRLLDCLWEASALQLPYVCHVVANQVARGWQYERFEKAWNELWLEGFELFKITECGKFFYSQRLMNEAEHIENISKTRSKIGKKGGLAKAKQKPSKSQAKAKQKVSHPDPDPDSNIPPISPKGDYSESFEKFWKQYPKKVGKDAAYKKWKQIGKSNNTKPGDIIQAIILQVQSNHFRGNDGSDYIPNPVVWLNQGRWKDEIKTAIKTNPQNFEHSYSD